MREQASAFHFDTLRFPDDFHPEEKKLYEVARQAALTAYAPYSGFRVGCAIRLANGQVVSGSNQENGAYPSGLCAERVALFYAGASHPDVPVTHLFIYALEARELVAPCGACRQVMAETSFRHGQAITIYFPAGSGVWYRIEDATLLLPFAFRLPSRL
ncbi:MAG: cytidine deaminase [Flavobacteriales bacterium]|nr:cytidine deaminase [Flavobacteriales bacterium]MCX7768662.1 cytidine deaminase [Flavobacteriales bacterium]MDW8410793.1 cytidine deaminase [Flavobacteriales bacterium]